MLTNPELLRETLSSNGENLARGMHMLAEDIEAGGGELRIRQSDSATFEVGRNLAVTPGKVIFQNDLMQLIQYAPTTGKVLKRPLLIVPPWINKFYILDLTPEKSFIKWCVDQGLTVFVISWVNPDARLAAKGFDDYMREGPLAALDAIKKATGESKVHMIGYCVGGTLLAVTLAYMAAKRRPARSPRRPSSRRRSISPMRATSRCSSTRTRSQMVERRMAEVGYLEGKRMANAFNMLRSHDLIWPYIVNNYLKGKQPLPFDLLYWNSDATRMPAANHSFYLRNCYLENKLSQGRDGGRRRSARPRQGQDPDLQSRDPRGPYRAGEVGVPRLAIVRRSGALRAGRLRPHRRRGQSAGKQQVPVLDRRQAERRRLRTWIAKAKEHPGSWWPDWLEWMQETGRGRSRGARARRRQAQADRGRARKLRAGEGLGTRNLLGTDVGAVVPDGRAAA